MENSATPMQPEDEVSCIWKTTETQKPAESFDQKYWKKIFISSCLFAFLVDPLYLYVPILKDDIKCLMLDPKLKIVVLLLRILTDLFYIMDIFIRIYRSIELNWRQQRIDFNFVFKSCVPRIAKAIWTRDILTDIAALLPLPYVVILSFFAKMSDLRSLTTKMVWMNAFVLFPYVPRVLRIYLSFKELKKGPLTKEIRDTPIWIKCVLNFYMYLIASHVAGALWYFFAVQRMMICWHSACRKNDGCDNRMFGCHDHHFFRNTTILNDLCPVSVGDNSSDTMFFDFGIFATVLKYGVVGSTSYFKKFLNCFWWGLQNLSSFGSNLKPSADGWENLYTVFISTSGLLMFLYLIGNLQMYMQFETTKREDHKRKMLIKQKMEEKGRDIELWLFKRGIPTRLNKDMKLQIMEKVQQALEESMEINFDNILPLLPSNVQSRIEDYISMEKLKQAPMLRGMDEGLLKIIYQKLEPARYTVNSFIIQQGEQLDKMVYIVDGFVSIEKRSSDDSIQGAGELCGQELLRWPFSTGFPFRRPWATESVKAIGVVEALALDAWHLKSIYCQSYILEKEKSRHRRMMKEEFERNIEGLIRKNGIPERWNQNVKSLMMENVEKKFQQDKLCWDLLDWDHLVYCLPRDYRNVIKRYMPLINLKQVPVLRGIDEDVLKIICQQLEPVRYTDNSFIIQKGEPLDKMVYIVDGFVSIEERSSIQAVGKLYGQELLRWPFSTYFPFPIPLATESVKAIGVVEALALNALDLQSIYDQSDIARKEASRHRRMMKEEMETKIDGLIRRKEIPEGFNQDVKSRIMKKIEEQFQKDDLYWDKLDWDHLVSHLPLDFQNKIKRWMAFTKLEKMSAFQNMDDEVLKEICNRLQPMKYNRTDNIIEKGDHIQMLLIVEGRIRQESWVKDAGEIYGQELLVWPFSTSFPDKVPTAAESPFVITNVVEALVLTASDMVSVATKFRKHFIKKYGKFVQKFVQKWLSDPFTDKYSEKAIKEATRNYTCLNNPNEGGYGTVYHTELDGRAVAIKTCNSATGDPFIQSQHLVHEAFLLLQISHKNVEWLLGCCSETRWPIMVYERTNALTLVEHFHINKSKLSLESLMKIAAETAGALAHLHSISIIHRDVKTVNILIDQTTHIIKVTGFEASRLLHEDEGEMEDEVSTLPGSSRYLDPEYLKSHDVYSFGVVLVELLTRQEAVSSNGSETSLEKDFVRSVQEDRLGQILDGEINTDEFSFEIAKKVSELAVKCLRPWREERPSMEEVAAELEEVRLDFIFGFLNFGVKH